MTLIVNLWGGPGAGKSTTAALLFGELKMAGVNAELVGEFAKDLTWEGRQQTLDNQVYIFGKQYHRLKRLDGQVDVIVTDSPLPFSLTYLNYSESWSYEFASFVMKLYKSMNNLNILVARTKPYSPAGRRQTEEEARALDDQILNQLNELNLEFATYHGYMPGLVDRVKAEL